MQKGAKSCGRSRAVGQMFKQTSNYLNSIWDLRGVPALESIALSLSLALSFSLPSSLLPHLAGSTVLLRSSCVPSVSFLLVFEPPPKMCRRPRGPRKKHERCISFDARVEPFPFMSRRFRPVTLPGSVVQSFRSSPLRDDGVAYAVTLDRERGPINEKEIIPNLSCLFDFSVVPYVNYRLSSIELLSEAVIGCGFR